MFTNTHTLRNMFFATAAALLIASVSTGCKKDDKEPDTPKAENLSPKFDAGFAAALQAEKIVKDAKYITADEIASVKLIDVSGSKSVQGELTSLKGIELFKSLTTLKCSYNKIQKLDLTSNTDLVEVDCEFNKSLEEIKVSGLTKLESLSFGHCSRLNQIDLSSCVALKRLSFPDSGLDKLDVSMFPNLYYIDAYNNFLEYIDISKNTKVTTLEVSGNPGTGDHYDRYFTIYVWSGFDANFPPAGFTQERMWSHQTADVQLVYKVK